MFKKGLVLAITIGFSTTVFAESMMLSEKNDSGKYCFFEGKPYSEGAFVGDQKCMRKNTSDALDENAPLVWESSFQKQN